MLHEALALSSDERAQLVHDILASLETEPTDDPTEVARAWNRELERRAGQAVSGSTHATDWAVARNAIRNQLASE